MLTMTAMTCVQHFGSELVSNGEADDGSKVGDEDETERAFLLFPKPRQHHSM